MSVSGSPGVYLASPPNSCRQATDYAPLSCVFDVCSVLCRLGNVLKSGVGMGLSVPASYVRG